MKSVFLDTNVLIDFLADQEPFSLDAAKLFNYSLSKKIRIYVSAISFNNIYYILRQRFSHSKCIEMLSDLNEWVEIIDLTNEIITKSLRSGFKDFEDAIQYNSANAVNLIEFIITRDAKDFKSSSLVILTPKEAISMLRNEFG